ncbi:hypothetical protein [Desulfovibrio gilichinskyi]|uniref:Haloacid dehalogenase-like hydrolase n=1 Tax=Desulfovibrio gilichinskyi TaxID=1519643 RepID=A0A1X7EA09_9BACT|nr:hypothetical protein [Desulfovibrio gilichinskyi]SMF30341.1 hypothetical protein SAMN06295933_2828 [Desulfovibrio gilichinskyi]
MRIGIDLDNTIIKYDKLFHDVALSKKLVGSLSLVNKRVIRDEIRLLHGDEEWQKLQVEVYGNSVGQAELMTGVYDFLLSLKRAGHSFQIVSHKTQYPNYGNSNVDLRKKALFFLSENGFFSENGLSMSTKDVFFLSTRSEKVKKISELNHSIFIDDLEEVFSDPDFPNGVTKILFSPEDADCFVPDVTVFSSFEKIGEHVFKGIDHGAV